MTIIKDGTGTGNTLEVDEKGRLQTFSTFQTELVSATKTGNAYSLSTGIITLTSDNDSAIFYLKSNETSPIVIHSILIEIGASTGGSGDVIQTNIIAPTSGTVISDASAAIVANLNATSSNTLVADVFKGAEEKTVAGGISVGFIRHLSQNFIINAGFILPKGSELAVSFQPPSGNTSLNTSLSLLVYLLNET